MATSTAIRNLQLGSGDPGAALTFNRSIASDVASSVPSATQSANFDANYFNTKLLELLKSYQTVGTKPFVEQGFDATDEQNRRISAETPADLIGASPSVQSAVRSASAGALDPTIAGAEESTRTFGESIQGLGTAIENIRKLRADEETRQSNLKREARENILLALETGGASGLEAIKREDPNIFKLAGLDEETLIESAKAKEAQELELKKTFSTVDLGDRIAVLDNRGNIVRTIPKGASPSTSAEAQEKEKAKQELLGLLGQYRDVLSKSSFASRMLDPKTVASLGNLKGQITAVYKTQEQLGALDAGVQKLIDTIIPGTGASITQLDTGAQVAALDNFIANQGGTPSGGAVTVQAPNGKTYQFPDQAQADAFKKAAGIP